MKTLHAVALAIAAIAGTAGPAAAQVRTPPHPAPAAWPPQPYRPGYIDTRWQNDPVTWYRIQHHGAYPPTWWYVQHGLVPPAPYRPYYPPYPVRPVYPVPVPVPVGTPSVTPPPAAPSDGDIHVYLPVADAKLEVNGTPFDGTGYDRHLRVPNIQDGHTHEYTVKATWSKGGQTVTRERKVTLNAGGKGVANFLVENPAK